MREMQAVRLLHPGYRDPTRSLRAIWSGEDIGGGKGDLKGGERRRIAKGFDALNWLFTNKKGGAHHEDYIGKEPRFW